MSFATEITLTGPYRRPAQLLASQQVDGHLSLHDESTAALVGLTGAPIEGPTHFSQVEPLAALVWGLDWFERGCISAHFRTIVMEGEPVQASLTAGGGAPAPIEVHKPDGTTVLAGSASVGPDHGQTHLDALRAGQRPPAELFILDRLEVGMTCGGEVTSIPMDETNGAMYPFSMADKLVSITEPHPWYTFEGGASSPWRRPVLPMEMISVLAMKTGHSWPVRSPAFALFLDLEIRLLAGPLFVDQPYRVAREIVGLSQSRRTESFWARTRLTDAQTGVPAAEVMLHSGFFKESYPGYPREKLTA
jgi:hypothetical protein